MKSRLKRLLHIWAEREVIATVGRAQPMPEPGFAWVYNPHTGGFHCGFYNRGKFVHSFEATFNRIPGTGPRQYRDSDEFGFAFRKLEEVDQGLILVAEFGGDSGWKDYLEQIRLSVRLAEKRLKQAWLALVIECRKRKLV